MTRLPAALLLAALPILSACSGTCTPSGCQSQPLAMVLGSTRAPSLETYFFMASATWFGPITESSTGTR